MDKEQLLYRYFSNELTPEEERQFNELLQNDPQFKEQFQFEQDLQQVIRDKEGKELKSRLIDFEADIAQQPGNSGSTLTNYQKWAMAASVAVLVGLAWFGYNTFFTTDFGDMYEANFEQYPNTVYTITRSDTVASLERNAFAAYETGDFGTALANFEKIPTDDRKEYLDFYRALSHMNLDQDHEARALFEKVIAAKSEFTAEATWYLALVSIKQADKDRAVRHLKALTADFDFNQAKATGLLRELE